MRIALVYKKTTAQWADDHAPRPAGPVPWAPLRELKARGDADHEACLARVQAALAARGWQVECHYRGELPAQLEGDLCVSVGGDGTCLEASHRLAATPMLPINSSSAASVGALCTAGPADFERLLDEFAAGHAPVTPLARIELRLDGRLSGPPATNDILLAHPNPAHVTRLTLELESRTGYFRSSGLWVATAAGSTGALASAGGPVLPVTSRELAWLVREPNPHPGLPSGPAQGRVRDGDGLRVQALNHVAAVYLDGSHCEIPLGLGQCLEVRAAERPLLLVGRPRRGFAEGR